MEWKGEKTPHREIKKKIFKNRIQNSLKLEKGNAFAKLKINEILWSDKTAEKSSWVTINRIMQTP